MSVKFLTGQGVDGDVGIGTNNPTAKLDVRTANGNTQSLRIGRLDAASYWDFNHAGNDLRIYNNGGTGQDILLGVNAAGTIYDNKVGIGTATPQSILNINGGTGSLSTGLTFGDGDTGIWEASDDNLRFSTASSTRMIIVSSGNVGIGTTGPSQAKLVVNGDIAIPRSNSLVFLESISGAFRAKITSQNSNPYNGLEFYTGNDEVTPKMTIRDSGNVGIGTTDPGAKLDVSGDLKIDGYSTTTNEAGLYLYNNIAYNMASLATCNSSYNAFRIRGRDTATNTLAVGSNGNSDYVFQVVNDAGTASGDISINPYGGNVGIGTTSPGYKLEVTGNARVSTNFYIGNVDAVTTATEVLVRQSDRVRGITPANLIDSISAPVTPGSITSTIVGETIEISFNESTTSNIDYYQVWSSDDGGDFGIIAQITPTDFSSTMTVVDTTFVTGGTMSYRVYAVKTGIYSSPGTTSTSYTVGVLNVTNMSVVNLNTAYYIQYEKPLSRFIDHIEIYMDSQTTQGALNRSNASIVYSGQNPSYMRNIGVSSNFHQFWVEVVTT